MLQKEIGTEFEMWALGEGVTQIMDDNAAQQVEEVE